MTIMRWLFVAFHVCTVAALNSTLLSNRTVASPLCTKPDVNVTQIGNATDIDKNCRTEIYNNYANDTQQTVKKVAQGSLNCTALNLYPDMPSFNVTVLNNTYYALETSYANIKDRYVWNGLLTNRGGQMSVVWDKACNSSVFQLDITLLAAGNGSQTQLTTRSCVNSTVDNCLWTVQITAEVRTEEPPRAVFLNNTAADTDIDNLNRKLFKRRLVDDRVLMHSGRELDDGSIIRVLYLYSIATQNRYGDATIKSMIASAHASSNEAFANSGLSFRLQVADIFSIRNAGNDMIGALSDLVNGNVPDVHLLRDNYKADIVQLIVEDTQYCGYSYMMTSPSTSFAQYAYNVVYSGCLVSYSSTHEIGHTMNLDHDLADSSMSSVYSYGVGNRFCNDGQTPPAKGTIPYFRTIMGYPCANSVRVPIFSGPFTYFQGTKTGDYSINNQYVLQQTHTTVANFRN